MRSSIINGEGELRGQPANPGLPGKWPLKRCMLSRNPENKLGSSSRKRRRSRQQNGRCNRMNSHRK